MHELPTFLLAGISNAGNTHIMDDGLQVLQAQLNKFDGVDSQAMSICCIVVSTCAFGDFRVMLGRPEPEDFSKRYLGGVK